MTLSFHVTGLADSGAFSEDGQIELVLHSGSEPLSLWMSLDTLQKLATSAAELHLAARTSIGTRYDPLETTAVPADAVKAERAIGLGMVIQSIRDGIGLIHRFALHPSQAEQLARQLLIAAKQAKREERKTRQ